MKKMGKKTTILSIKGWICLMLILVVSLVFSNKTLAQVDDTTPLELVGIDFASKTIEEPTTIDPLLIAIMSALSGAIVAAFFTWFTWRHSERRNLERELLSEALSVQALKEAWILEGQDLNKLSLSSNKGLPSQPMNKGPWLHRVEVRAVLDDESWTYHPNPFYGFKDGRRTWIVRDIIREESDSDVDSRPGLLSSKAKEELCGWIERVASARSGHWLLNPRLSNNGLKMIYPLLNPLAQEDKLKVLESALTPRAQRFLKKHNEKMNLILKNNFVVLLMSFLTMLV